jgi:CRISPR-associated protein Cmr1
MRKQDVPIPEVNLRPQPQIVTQEREYRLMTPLYGGGAIPGERDERTVVRGTEVRGQLRFWWRACYGGRYKTVVEMKEAEDLLWGAAARPKKEEEGKENGEDQKKDDEAIEKMTVQIMVDPINANRITETQLYRVIDKNGRYQANPINTALGYVAFPLQPTREELSAPTPPQVKPVFENVNFRLTISFPGKWQKDIEGTLWAWEIFGGIGARTRRGFGALSLTKKGNDPIDLPPSDDPIQWLRDRIASLQAESEPPVKGKAPENVPCLLPEMKMQYIGPFDTARKAWEGAVEKLLKYRQFPNGRYQEYGHTKWPEAETIRILTKKKRRDASSPPQKFPRAAFGLPIIFNFLKEGSDLQKRPLQGKAKNHDRLASPVLLRPLMCKSNGGKKEVAIGLAIVLENFSFPPEGIVFVEKNGTAHPADPSIEKEDVDWIKPLYEKDVLSDFMNYFGYVEGNQ